jgi:capsule biosynthesis phosphatase
MKRLIVDIDGTIARAASGDYADAAVIDPVRQRLRDYQSKGFTIVLHSARNMRTYEGNTGLIAANTLPLLITWLDRHKVPYDEIHLGKPWCGQDGFYIDDKAVRPDEFASLDIASLNALLEASKARMQQIETASRLDEEGAE